MGVLRIRHKELGSGTHGNIATSLASFKQLNTSDFSKKSAAKLALVQCLFTP